MKQDVYLHTVNNRNFNSRRDISTVSYILDCNSLLSLRNQGISESISFAGLDHISLCDYEKKNITNNGNLFYNSFYSYIRHGISFAFDKKTLEEVYEVKRPTILEVYNSFLMNYYRQYMKALGNEEKRYSDLPDEVQIKDKISLDYLSFITYPCEEFFDSRLFFRYTTKRKKLIEEINSLRSVLISHGKDLDIYDINTGILLDEEGIEKVIRLTK